jgi:RND family efflux transporter MFP subunit
MNKIVKYGIVIGVGILGIVVFYNKVYLPKTTYKTFEAKRGIVKNKVFGIGNVDAKNIYNITAQMSGRILQINTDINKWVNKGDLLIKIDSINLKSQIKEAKIGVVRIKKQLLSSEKAIDSLKAKQKYFLSTFKRYQQLYKNGYSSKAEYDKAKSDLDSIQADIESQKLNLKALKEDVKKANQAVISLQEKLKRYNVYAPVSGYVISKNGEVGQSVTTNQAILQIVNPKDVWVKTYIDEKLAGDIRVGQLATIKLRSNNQVLKGYVKRIMPKSDLVTLEREIDVAFDKTPIPFYMNEQAEVEIVTKILKQDFKLPSDKIVFYDSKAGVWISKNSKAHFVPLKIEGRSDKYVAVKGLKSDDKIIILSPNKKTLKEGMRIHND